MFIALSCTANLKIYILYIYTSMCVCERERENQKELGDATRERRVAQIHESGLGIGSRAPRLLTRRAKRSTFEIQHV